MAQGILLSFAVASIGLLPLSAQSLIERPDDFIPAQADSIYKKGINYLAQTQTEQGNWQAKREDYEVGVAGLCIMAFLAQGEDPVNGPHSKNIQRAVSYIISQQNEANGYIGASMYNHAFATTALAETYGMIPNPEIGPALENAVELILSAQERNTYGGWRYTPDSKDADTTVSGCQLVALFAARNAGLKVPDEAIRKGLAYLRKNRIPDEGSFRYSTTHRDGSPTLTAISVLCFALAKQTDTKGFENSVNYLKNHLKYRDPMYPHYFEYYMSQALFQSDEKAWNEWNQNNIRYMATIQNGNGSFPGRFGNAFNTAGALLSIALNYRFLPIYEK